MFNQTKYMQVKDETTIAYNKKISKLKIKHIVIKAKTTATIRTKKSNVTEFQKHKKKNLKLNQK